MTDNTLRALLGPFYKSVRRPTDGEWFLEGVEDERVLAACVYKKHYLRVAIVLESSVAKIQILEARNLKYDGVEIHGQALVWIRNLELRLRRVLSQAALATQ